MSRRNVFGRVYEPGSLSRSLFQCKNRLYLFSTKVFSKAEIAKELR